VAANPFCGVCDGTGWIPYRSEALDGKLEEAYRLCPNCQVRRYCVGSTTDRPCPRPGTVRDGYTCSCDEHTEVIRYSESVDDAREAIYYLSRWLRIARDMANSFLEMRLSEALGEAEVLLESAKRTLD
jgi:hypothetical protein